MKITKQRLKEIIKEELTAEGSREQMMMPAISMADMEAAMATDEPRHEGGTPEERLLNKLLIVSKVGSAPDAGAAAEMLGLGGDEEVVAYLDSLMGNQMYDSPGLEEATPEGYPMTNRQKRAEIGMPEEEPLRLSRPKHDPLDRSPARTRARRRLQGKGIKNYPLDK